jgi:hypothetical protein
MEQEIVTAIHYTTIAIILRRADLQPHRSRYWKTAIWNEVAISQAELLLRAFSSYYLAFGIRAKRRILKQAGRLPDVGQLTRF